MYPRQVVGDNTNNGGKEVNWNIQNEKGNYHSFFTVDILILGIFLFFGGHYKVVI